MSVDPFDDHYAGIGFMFEGSEASTLKHYEFQHENKIVKVALNVVDQVPGAVQSGHYLWPAAPTLARYLLQLPLLQPTAVLELGAGCALASVTALQVFDSIKYLSRNRSRSWYVAASRKQSRCHTRLSGR
jgi:predicted nicotinamide N-methyase